MKNKAGDQNFCPVCCSMKELEKKIRSTKKGGDLLESKFLEGVRHCRIIMGCATNGAVS